MRPNDEISAIFGCLSPPILVIYYAFAFLFEEKIPKICIRNVKKMNSNRWLLQRILHQNAVQYAPKRKVKCSKTRGKMQQKRGKMQQNVTKVNKETAF